MVCLAMKPLHLEIVLLFPILEIIIEVFGLSLVSVQLYSPHRPVVDVAEVFLWLMAVGTIVCASYWSAWSANEASIEHDKLLKVFFFFGQKLFASPGSSFPASSP